jgi:NAD(P)-dependent dehydrogenase (short-subunit alcohol dehydrogenase family)
MDHTNLDSVSEGARVYKESHDTLDLLICLAAIMPGKNITWTKDGYEEAYQVNYLAHFLLIHELMEQLENVHGRVVNVSSSLCLGISGFSIDNKLETSHFMYRYVRSKLAQVMMTKYMAVREKDIEIVAVYPGVIKPEVLEGRWLQKWFRTPLEGVEAICYVALSGDIVNGAYYAEDGTIRTVATNNSDNAMLYMSSLSCRFP